MDLTLLANAVEFLQRHLDTLAWAVGLLAMYSLGFRRALAWLQTKEKSLSPETRLAIDYGYAAVQRWIRSNGKPAEPAAKALEFTHDLLQRLKETPLEARAEAEWTIRHEEERAASPTVGPPKA